MQNQSLVINTQAGATMSSLEFRDVINAAREEHGESKVENRHLLARVEDELAGELGGRKTFRPAQGGTPMAYYDLTIDQCMLVGMRESKSVRRKVLVRLKELESSSPSIPSSFADALRLAADQQEQIQQLQITNQHSAMKIDVLEQLLAAGVSAPEFCRRLNGVNTQKINSFLLDAGWVFMTNSRIPRWRVASYARDKHMTEREFEVERVGSDPFTVTNPVLLKAGAKRLVELYMASKLPMKKTWDGELKHGLAGVVEVVQ